MFGSPIGDGRYASELVLKGAQAEKDGTSTKGEKEPAVKVARWKADLTTRLADAVPAADLSAKVRDAALYIAHGFAAERGGALTEKDMQAAAEIAIGGSLIDHNGRNTVIPPGMTSSTFDERLRKMEPAELARQAPTGTVLAGGQETPLAAFVQTLPGQKLVARSPGQYVVLVGDRPVTNMAGQIITIGIR